ncbi:hypothetical protein [Helicobacter salomonis]|uniref:hypothetical protein n=1 Tax=Helicobacter salomonis TaxID=56878 RepID=UPI000CF09D14|nr:hypothetical protein [Helicobacter salomonis]
MLANSQIPKISKWYSALPCGGFFLVLTLASTASLRADIRNGFFVAGELAVTNIEANRQKDPTPVTTFNQIPAKALQQSFSTQLGKAKNALDQLIASVDAQQKTGSPLAINPDQLKRLQSFLAGAQQDLQKLKGVPEKATLQNMEQALQNYEKTTASFLEAVKQYNATMNQDTQNYDQEVAKVDRDRQQYQAVADNIKNELTNPVGVNPDGTFNNNVSMQALLNQMNAVLQNFEEMANNGNNYRILTPREYENAVQYGQNSVCNTQSITFEQCFQKSFNFGGPSPFDPNGGVNNQEVIAAFAWFQRELLTIQQLANAGKLGPGVAQIALAGLQAVYDTQLTVLNATQGSSLKGVLGTPETNFPSPTKPAPPSWSTPTTPPSPFFNPLPASVGVAAKTFINSLSHHTSSFWQDKSYSVGAGFGGQYFFLKHLGIDASALGGYTFYDPASADQVLKKLNAAYVLFSANLLVDLLVGKTNFFGVYAGFAEKLQFSDYGSKRFLWDQTMFDIGLRYQHARWVYKLGVRSPFAGTKTFMIDWQDAHYFLDNKPSDLSVYFMLEYLF